MMLQRLRLFLNRVQVTSLVDRVVARSHRALWQRVRDRAWKMSPHEARGYIRARAALIVDREMRIAVAEMPEMPASQMKFVTEVVRWRLIERTLADAHRMREATRPLRRAA